MTGAETRPGPSASAGPAVAARPGAAGRSAPSPPPFRIPGQHFAASLLFLISAAALLVWRAPALAGGAFLDRGLVTATHLLTLGWISTSIMGVLYQFLPVALGSAIRWQALADVTFAFWTTGVVVFVAGLLGGTAGVVLGGASLLGVAVLLFVANLAATLRRTPRRGLTWWCVAGAGLSLLGTWLLGALLATNLSSGILGGGRLAVLAIHVHVAVGGWVMLTIVGVAHHFLPMFLLSHGGGDRSGTVAAGLLGAGTAGLLLTEHLLPLSALEPSLGLVAAGTAAFLYQAFLHYGRRRRPRLDPGMRLVGGALALLALALTAGVAVLTSSSVSPGLATAYGILLVPGGLGLLVAGHYYRIVPFLTWFHRFGPVAAEQDVPRITELFDHRIAHAAGTLLTGGVVAMAGGAVVGEGGICVAGAGIFGGGALMEGSQMAAIARRRP